MIPEMTQKVFIKNRFSKQLAVLVEANDAKKGLAFVAHGLSGFKEQTHIQAIANAFTKHGMTAVRFDVANTLGESEGRLEDARVGNYLSDLEDVIAWAAKQPWYVEPFYISGHSLGGTTLLLYAEQQPEKIAGLIPVSAAPSGTLYRQTFSKEELENWEKTGWKIRESKSKPGVLKKISWSFLKDFCEYDVLPGAGKLKMPALIIVGENDKTTPLMHQKLLYEKIAGPKQLHVIKGATHNFRNEKELAELEDVIGKWLISQTDS
jgi:pimeloyl-ACP methyl ester carboxylesterase